MYEYNEMIDRLKKIIDERKISIKQLSELADVPYRTLYKIITKETKEPSVNIMIRIAKALNITTDNLIFGKDTKGNEFQSNFIINLRAGGFMKKQNTKTALNYKSAKEMRIYIAEKYGINSTEELKTLLIKVDLPIL